MYKVLIVDDEPLARMGIASMLENCQLDVEVSGMAANGKAALDCMQEAMPDIVITDIRMPVMDGLELLEQVKALYKNPPCFIFLTSYEDFSYAKKALYLSACRYLVKMELCLETLTEAVSFAIQRVAQTRPAAESTAGGTASNVFINRFYSSLLNGSFHSEEEIWDRAQSYNQNIRAQSYVVACTQITYPADVARDYMQQYNLYLRILDTVYSSVSLHGSCFVVAYHRQCIAVVLMLQAGEDGHRLAQLALQDADALCHQYFRVKLLYGIGTQVPHLQGLAASFASSQAALVEAGGMGLGWTEPAPAGAGPSIAQLDKNLISAFEHIDVVAFNQEMDTLAQNIQPDNIPQSMDALACVIHVVINCLANGEKILGQAFEGAGNSYQMLYTCSTASELQMYLQRVRQAVSMHLHQQIKDPKYALVTSAKAYIRENCYNKLSLGEVAAAIGISQNYLSGLFRQYSELGFNDYVTSLKVKTAREMLAQGNWKVYQVSEKLGFETPHYFSKVYKKFTGYSPSEVVGYPQNTACKKGEHCG